MTKLVILLLSSLVCFPLGAATQKSGSRVVAVFPVVRGVGGGKAVTRAVGSVLSAATGETILSGRALRKKLRKKPLSSLKKCGEDVACLAALGKKVGATEIVVARTAAADDGGTRIVVQRIDVATAKVTDTVELSTKKPLEVETVLSPKLARLLEPSKTTVAKGETESPADTDKQTAGDTTPTEETIATSGSTETEETTADGETITASESTTVDAAGTAVTPATKPVSYKPGILMWSGLGGVVVGGTLAGVGFYFGSRARDLRQLEPGTSQLEVMEQQDEQRRDASLANGLVTSGFVVLVGGLTAAALDFLLGQPSAVAVNVTPDGGSVGVAFSW